MIDQVVDEAGVREGVGLEQPAGQRVVDADRVVVRAGNPQAAAPVDVQARGLAAGHALDEDPALTGAGVAPPDGAVGHGADVQAAVEAGGDALGLEAVGQVDVGSAARRRVDAVVGADRGHRREQEGREEPQQEGSIAVS